MSTPATKPYNPRAGLKPIYRRWLTDRIRGKSKYGNGERPWGPCCWVPPIVGWCPGLWEDNSCCKLWGSTGAYSSERSRFWCMHLGFIANVFACILVSFSCFAISQDYGLLAKSSFGSIVISEIDDKVQGEILLDIGLRGIALDNPFTGVETTVVAFENFCEISDEGLQRYIDPANCAQCEEQSLTFVLSAILAAVSFVPTFFTDILRMFSGYDVNCQKCFGTLFSLLTVGAALNVAVTWKLFCADGFFKNQIYLDRDGNRLSSPDDPDTFYTFDYQYEWGYGMICLILGAALKTFQVLAHFCIPTPSVTRDLKEQKTYEVIEEENLVDEESAP